MASQPAPQLPVFYNNLVPLDSNAHAGWGMRQEPRLGFARGSHAIPITVDEFAMAQKSYPIVFGTGEGAVPLALVGLTEGQNMFVGEDGEWRPGAYIPAYVRRHPFMLARLTPDAQVLSLVFDDTADMLGPDHEAKLFADGQPSEITKNVLNFCEQFEQAVARTKGFMDEVEKLGLLMEGEASIQQPGMEQPAIFRGFRMVDEQKLQNLRGDQARKMVQNGMMGLIYAHLFSLGEMQKLFAEQVAAQGAAQGAGAVLQA